MNAKETIKKIADALNITSEETVKEVKEVETPVEAVVETAVEAPKEAEATPEVAEVVEEVKVEENDSKEPVEAIEEAAPANAELEAMKAQIEELKSLLRTAVKEDSKKEEVIEVAEQPVKPLTHNPEANVPTNTKKIGGHGGDVLSRVYKYMS
tara:strand:+ start:351 stop:809 length:459 start_codon:yes stop_codon:yes gene_type:complete